MECCTNARMLVLASSGRALASEEVSTNLLGFVIPAEGWVISFLSPVG